MNKLVRLKQADDQKVYFISDLHHFHNPVRWDVPLWKQRGYNDVTEMNEDQITTINALVRPNDILWHLGDITLNCNEGQFESFIARLNCQNIYCLWGNHNSPTWAIYQREIEKIKQITNVGNYTGSSEDIEIYPLRYKNLVFFGNYQELVVDGQCMVLEHYPIHVFNNMKDGVWHLCGHSHYNLPFSKADNLKSKILDVGWDGQLKPYSMEDLRKIMDTKQVFDAGDHHAHGK